MANFIVDFMFGPEKGNISSSEKAEMSKVLGAFGAPPQKSISEMTEEEYDAAVDDILKTVKYNMPITPEGDIEPKSRSGINARSMAELALDRGLPMYQPAGENRTFTDQQYLDALAQQPPTNKYFSPEEDALARQQFAQQMSAFKNQMAGFNKLYPNVNAMTRSPNVNAMYSNPAYDALVFGPANNPAPFSAGPSQGEVNTLLPSNRFQARRIGR